MVLQYLHGIETIDVDDSIRPIRTVRSAIIGLIGTAPDADASIWPLNVPVLISGNPRQGVTLGTTGTIPDALNQIFKETNPIIVVVRVAEGDTINETYSNLVGSALTQTGVYAFNKAQSLLNVVPKLLIAPGYTGGRPTDGVLSVSMTAGGAHYTNNVAATFTGAGVGVTARVTVVGGVVTAVTPLTKGWGFGNTPPTVAFVDNGAVKATGNFTLSANAGEGDTVTIGAKTYTFTATVNAANKVLIGSSAAATIANLVQAVIAGTGSGTLYGTGTTANANTTAVVDSSNNLKADLTAIVAGYAGNSIATTTTSSVGSCAHTTLQGGLGGTGATATAVLGHVANPVVAELDAVVLGGLRAIAIVDSPGTSYADAIAYRNDFDSQRLWIVEGGFQVWNDDQSEAVAVPAAPLLAGKQAYVDDNSGFWFSASNWPIEGVIGVNRAIDFSLFSSNSEGQLLNETGIAVTVGGNGYRVMGVRAPTSETLWAFLPVRRTADMVYESIEYAIRSAVDKPISVGVIDWIEGSVRSYLRYLQSVGAIIDGNCWIDRTNNPVTELQNGHVTFDIDLEPPAPMERITFRAHRNAGYYTEILDAVTKNVGV